MKLAPVVSREEASDSVRLSLDIQEDLACFRGHFPGVPVLPGVVQLHWAVQVAREYFGLSGNPLDVQRLKFKSVVIPPAAIQLELVRVGPADVRFKYSSPAHQYSEGCLKFAGADQ